MTATYPTATYPAATDPAATYPAGLGGPAIEMDPEDVESRGRQRLRGGGTEAGGGAQDERPAGEVDRSGRVGHASGEILAHLS